MLKGRHRHNQKRDNRYELLRIIAMFCVVLCHVIAYNGWALEQRPGWVGVLSLTADQYAGQFGVAVFYMLSGFFLVGRPFRSDHLTKTVVQTFSYSVLALFAGLTWGAQYTVKDVYMSLFPILNNVYWFITAYVIMLALSPVLNMIFDRFEQRYVIALITLLLSFSVLPYISFIGFKYNGLLWTTVIYAVCCYLVGGYVRQYNYQLQTRVIIIMTIIAAIGGLVVLSLFFRASQEQWSLAVFFGWQPRSVYGSLPIFSIFTAAGAIALVSKSGTEYNPRWIASPKVSSVTNVIASSTMGIYLIHQHPIIAGKLWTVVSHIQYPGTPAMGVLVIVGETVMVFTVLAVISICINAVVVPMSVKVSSVCEQFIHRRL